MVSEVRFETFFPTARAIIDEFSAEKDFVHYTHISAAMSIIQNEEIWLRRSELMNDFSEVRWGCDCLEHALSSDSGEEFFEALDQLHPELSAPLRSEEDRYVWYRGFQSDLYLISFAEHGFPLNENESPRASKRWTDNDFGRLFMWTAYGGDAPVALVFDRSVLLSQTDLLQVYSSPVAYLMRDDFPARLSEITEKISANQDALRKEGLDRLRAALMTMARFAAVCTKHPSFIEEREWRAIYSPRFARGGPVKIDHETARGIPQPVAKLPLKLYSNGPDEAFDLRLEKILKRIIVGPHQGAELMQEALVQLLRQMGVPNAANLVHLSGIPLRS